MDSNRSLLLFVEINCKKPVVSLFNTVFLEKKDQIKNRYNKLDIGIICLVSYRIEILAQYTALVLLHQNCAQTVHNQFDVNRSAFLGMHIIGKGRNGFVQS